MYNLKSINEKDLYFQIFRMMDEKQTAVCRKNYKIRTKNLIIILFQKLKLLKNTKQKYVKIKLVLKNAIHIKKIRE